MRAKLHIILCAILMAIAFVGIEKGRVFADDDGGSTTQTEQKIYCTATLQDDFKVDKIIVVLTKEASRRFTGYTLSAFNGIRCSEVVDLGSYTTNTIIGALSLYGNMNTVKTEVEKNTLIDVDAYHKVLSLTMSVLKKEDILQEIRLLEQRDDVLSAEPNYLFSKDSFVLPPRIDEDNQDMNECESWGMENVNAYEALRFTTGDESVKIGVVDVGIDGVEPTRQNGLEHGTMVLGTIKSLAQNASFEESNYFDVENSEESLENLLISINDVHRGGASIINLSLGFYVNSNALKIMMGLSRALYVCSAGNNNNNNDDNPFLPANLSGRDNVITVGAIGEDNNRWDSDETHGSNYGENTVSIYAPGEDILTDFPKNLCNESANMCSDVEHHVAYGYHIVFYRG